MLVKSRKIDVTYNGVTKDYLMVYNGRGYYIIEWSNGSTALTKDDTITVLSSDGKSIFTFNHEMGIISKVDVYKSFKEIYPHKIFIVNGSKYDADEMDGIINAIFDNYTTIKAFNGCVSVDAYKGKISYGKGQSRNYTIVSTSKINSIESGVYGYHLYIGNLKESSYTLPYRGSIIEIDGMMLDMKGNTEDFQLLDDLSIDIISNKVIKTIEDKYFESVTGSVDCSHSIYPRWF